MQHRSFAVLALTLAVLVAQSARSPACPVPPPQPPKGWDEHVLPGFNPSIESVVIDLGELRVSGMGDRLPARTHKALQNWGAKAVPALIGLYEKPEWDAFKPAILLLLAERPCKESTDFVFERLRTLLDAKPIQMNGELWVLLRVSPVLVDDKTTILALEVFARLDEGIGPDDYAGANLIRSFIEFLAKRDVPAVNDALRSKLKSGNEAFAGDYARGLSRHHPAEALELANAAYARATTSSGKRSLLNFLDDEGAFLRAQLPISRPVIVQESPEVVPPANSSAPDEFSRIPATKLGDLSWWIQATFNFPGAQTDLPEVERRSRKKLTNEIVQILKSRGWDKAVEPTRVAGALRLTGVAEELGRFVKANANIKFNDYYDNRSTIGVVLWSYARVNNRTGVERLLSLANDSSTQESFRGASVLALGNLNTAEADNALRGIYAARERDLGLKPLTPDATHAQAMWRAVALLYPDKCKSDPGWNPDTAPASARVGRDFSSGSIESNWMEYSLFWIDNRWIVRDYHRIPPPPIP